jgi:hypothetical protein
VTELLHALPGLLLGLLIWDAVRRVIKAYAPQTLKPDAEARMVALERALDVSNKAQAQLAREWLVKFAELEVKWSQLEEHIGSKVAGTVAQLGNRGFGR